MWRLFLGLQTPMSASSLGVWAHPLPSWWKTPQGSPLQRVARGWMARGGEGLNIPYRGAGQVAFALPCVPPWRFAWPGRLSNLLVVAAPDVLLAQAHILDFGSPAGLGGGCRKGGFMVLSWGLGSLSMFEGHPGDVLRGLCHGQLLVQLLLGAIHWHCQTKGIKAWRKVVLADALGCWRGLMSPRHRGAGCARLVADHRLHTAAAGASPALSLLTLFIHCNPHLPPQLSCPPVTPLTRGQDHGSRAFSPPCSSRQQVLVWCSSDLGTNGSYWGWFAMGWNAAGDEPR